MFFVILQSIAGADSWLPFSFYTTFRTLSGYIASIPKIDFNSTEQFVIDAQVFQGSSGSPVFVSLNGKYKLIGIISQTMIKQGKLKAVPTVQTQIGIDQILGLGIVIKSTLMKELIEKALSKVEQ